MIPASPGEETRHERPFVLLKFPKPKKPKPRWESTEPTRSESEWVRVGRKFDRLKELSPGSVRPIARLVAYALAEVEPEPDKGLGRRSAPDDLTSRWFRLSLNLDTLQERMPESAALETLEAIVKPEMDKVYAKEWSARRSR